MTKEKAIDLLDNLIGMIDDNQENDYDGAIRKAISCLKTPEHTYDNCMNFTCKSICRKEGYQQGRADALDHCEKCETDQWDALYKAEMKGRADAIEEFMIKAMTKFYNFDVEHGYPTHNDVKDILFDVANELKEQNNE